MRGSLGQRRLLDARGVIAPSLSAAHASRYVDCVRCSPLVILLFASTAAAQSVTTGAISGRTLDKITGEALPGVTIIVSSPANGATQSAITDENGAYKVSDLLPGDYVITFYADKSVVTRKAHVSVDETTIAIQKLGFSTTQDIIEVHGDGPQIDTQSPIRATKQDSRYLGSLPIPGRNATDAAGAASGATNDGVGIAVSGSTGLENRYLVDGVDITGLTFGNVGTPVLNEFVQEIEVITGGYNAEYGRATGGIVNIVTKSGTNTIKGSVFGTFQPGFLTRRAQSTPVNASSVDITSNRAYDADFGAEVGGPIIKDKLWFYLGMAPTLTRTDYTRTTKSQTDCRKTLDNGQISDCEKMYADGRPDIDPRTGFFLTDEIDSEARAATSRSYSMIGKLNLAVDAENQAQLSLIALPSSSDSPALVGLPSGGTRTSGLTTDAAARWTSKLDDGHTEVEALIAWHRSTLDGGAADPAFDSLPRQDLVGGNLGIWSALGGESAKTTAACADGGASDRYPTITNCPMTSLGYHTGGPGALLHEREDRKTGRVSIIERLGKHEIKAGLDGELANKLTTRGYSGGAVIQNDINSSTVQVSRWVALAGAGNADPSFDEECRTADPNATKSGGKIGLRCKYLGAKGVAGQTLSWAGYLRDSWQVAQNVVLNAGVRYEEQRLRYAAALQNQVDALTGESVGKNAMSLTGNLAPRLGIVWDPTFEGRSKIFGSWGRFYEAIPMDINDRSFGGEVSYTQTFNTKAMPAPCGTIDPKLGGVDGIGCLNATVPATTEQVIGSKGVLVAPGIKAEYLDEMLVGGEYQIAADWKIGLTYQNRRLGRVIEDVSTDGAQTYIIANPGEWADSDEQVLVHRIAQTSDPATKARLQRDLALFQGVRTFDKPTRNYNAIEATISHRFSRGLFVSGSYTYSSTEGNYPGSASYTNGQIDPNISSQYDLIELLANRKGQLPQDRPHSLKVDAFYTFDLGDSNVLTIGGRARAISGIPENALGGHYLYGPNESFLLPRGTMGRTQLEHGVDLHVSYGRRLNKPTTAELFADIFNIYDSQAGFNVDETYAPQYKPSTGTPNFANPISGGQYRDLVYAKAFTQDGGETSAVIGRNPNFGHVISRYAPTSVRLGFRVSF